MPSSRFEHFSLECDPAGRESLQSAACHLTGSTAEVVAHRDSHNLTIAYRALAEIEIACGGEFRGEGLSRAHYGVTFRADVLVTARAAGLLLPRDASESALTRVTYWQLKENDFYALAFLRDKKDQQLFLAALSDAEMLLRFARLSAVGEIAQAAYARAREILAQAGRLSPEASAEFCLLIGGDLARGSVTAAQKAIDDLRWLDRSGEAGFSLAATLSDHGFDRHQITAVLDEAVSRLTHAKPRHYSTRLSEILDFVIAEKLPTPESGQLLWQTYLAAAAERALALLRRTFITAKILKADRDTLEMIYKTWRGFVDSEPGREKPKRVRAPKWLTLPKG